MSAVDKGLILVVDDEASARRVLSAILEQEDYRVVSAGDVDEAIQALSRHDFDTVITDMKMPGADGLQLHDQIKQNYPEIPVIFLTAYGTVESAVNAMNLGAFYYFVKPPDYLNLKGILARAVEQRRLKRELAQLRQRLTGLPGPAQFIGQSRQMHQVCDLVEAIKDSPSSVLICGETGVGKELAARALHYGSVRRDAPFVTVNCAAIPGELLESELFVYEKGAFTGAVSRRIGRIEQAAGGTLFLDEIGELDISLQAKLLRVLQEKEVERLGDNRRIPVDFRLVSSTNRELPQEVAKGTFREDLFYRINVVRIDLPSLRERREDIPLLVSEFVKEFCVQEGKVLVVSEKAMQTLCAYHWPGNVRQLRNVVERAVVLSRGREILPSDLPDEVRGQSLSPGSADSPAVIPLRELEAEAIRRALAECSGNKSLVAKKLGCSRKALYRRLKEYDLS
ncbi:sigma-54-dependent transcriptional regulator [Desulfuromonas acetexigens]|uniref:Sigma-54-dependent Fis family transcriptional regulator n=1 Tax=Trichloromonas acetexigens TaxID=38815 RepID=A0A550JJE5_9BACT|nr:sigma-54 dependent transcriptional regulator [Desulfuromonas acetexigens]TRO83339.1 sigma-54-dependent Fis family transcriptional regulator [Desulfuromonas acetexigens]